MNQVRMALGVPLVRFGIVAIVVLRHRRAGTDELNDQRRAPPRAGPGMVEHHHRHADRVRPSPAGVSLIPPSPSP
ncbi:MAG TPA: hypothetical protein VL738_19745, partial [Dactylosporangium sp.]|nr:hypothetical protein [Dactylosporangium sp.]